MRRSVLIGLAVAGVATSALAGWEYTAVTRGEGGKGARQMDATVKAWVEGKQACIEFQKGRGPMEGGYLISTDGGETVFLVNPKDKTFMVWDVGSIAGMAGAAMDMMNLKVSDMKVEKLGESAGETMHKHPTRKHKIRTSYATQMSFFGMSKTARMTREQEIWVAPDIEDAGLNVWLKAQAMKTGNAELDKLIGAERSKVKGFPLKQVTVTTQESGGKQEINKVVMQITELKKVSVPASQFKIPEGYTEVNLADNAEAALDQAEKDAEGDEEAESRINALKGLMKAFKKK